MNKDKDFDSRTREKEEIFRPSKSSLIRIIAQGQN